MAILCYKQKLKCTHYWLDVVAYQTFSVTPNLILSAQNTHWLDFSGTQLHISTQTIKIPLSMF